MGVWHWWDQTISNYPKGTIFHQINPMHMHYLDDDNAQVIQIN
jgi:hypothetical protein